MTTPDTATIPAFHRDVLETLGTAIAELSGDAEPVAAGTLPLSDVPEHKPGDVALPCFVLRGRLDGLAAKKQNNPVAIAAAIADRIDTSGVLSRAQAMGPYLNLTYDLEALARAVIGQALNEGDAFGRVEREESDHVVIEYSAPNTNKPQHLGHVRNNVLGESVARCLAHAGYQVTRVNLVNDRGIHICKSMLAYERWGHGVAPDEAGAAGPLRELMFELGIWSEATFADGIARKGDHFIGDFYVLFDKMFGAEYERWLASDDAALEYEKWRATRSDDEEADGPETPSDAFERAYRDTYFNEHSELGRAARRMLIAWEEEDPKVRALWRKLNGWVLAGFEETYSRMGIAFDRVDYESETYRAGKAIVEQGLESGVFSKRADGAVVFDLDAAGLQGEKVMLRSDGTSVYITQDLGTALARRDDIGFDQMIYVVGDEQNYHFKVLFAVLEALDPSLKDVFEHLAYGLVNLPHGRMKSREGTVVDADDLMDEMHALGRANIESKLGTKHYQNVDEAEVERRAEAIGQAGLKYFLLDVNPKTTMLFDPDQSIDPQGRTGVYALYNYARTRSLLRKANDVSLDLDVLRHLGTDHERQVILEMSRWPEVVRRAAAERDPSRVAEFIFNVCKPFAYMFTDREGHPIATCPDPALRHARLLLADAVGTAIRVAARLLGMKTLEEL